MITIEKISQNNKDLGVEISIGDEKYFIGADQKGWPGIRIGEFPKAIMNGKVVGYDTEIVFTANINEEKP